MSALDTFHPVVSRWFRERFGSPTDPQTRGWPEIAAGRDTLIAAPTGSGKTLAAFLVFIDQLMKRGADAPLPDAVSVIYVSPLKALSNDIHRNLDVPLRELREAAAKDGIAFPDIRTFVRTGDTPASERSKMVRKPPHILITTPESLYILLTAERSRRALATAHTVIVDEIHAVAASKRGAHLTLTLERLDRLVTESGHPRPARVGLSATQRPIEMIGHMLAGTRRPMPTIVDGGHARTLDVAIELTDDELGAIASHEQFGRVYDRIADLVREHETTLVFVNTRTLVERVAHNLEERLGQDQVVAHHGSLSRKIRFAAEQKLKYGSVKCAVATASLELGIDVGSVDLVVQIGSPRSIATFLQRVGRSGHSLGKTPKGRLFAMTRDQLVECAALVRAMKQLRLDVIEPRESPLDILAQQMVAVSACEELKEQELFDLARGSFHYRDLDRDTFDAVLEMLGEGFATRRGRVGARVHRDRINGVVKGRRGARLAAITCGGAIPDNFNYPVVQYPEETPVGNLDEDFAIESSAGDIILLGNTSWRIRRVEAGRVIVEDARGLPPTIPFWLGEAPARTTELSEEVSALRSDVQDRFEAGATPAEISEWLAVEASTSVVGAEQLVAYMLAARKALGTLPTRNRIVAERFFDEGGGMQLVIHAPLGGRINKAWGLALRKKFCRSFNFELQAAATDDGIVISLGPPHAFPLAEVFEYVRSASAEKTLTQAVLAAPVFGVRWRWNTTRGLAVLRRRAGKKVPPQLLRMKTDDLLTLVFPMQQACLENVVGDIEIPDHPLVTETMRDCLGEFMDIDGLTEVLAGIESGAVEVVARDTTEPSPLSHEIINANPYAYLDDVPLEERRTRAVSLPRGLKGLDERERVIDAAAIETAEDQARPPMRDADELHDALLSMHVLCSVDDELAPIVDELIAAGRATRIVYAHGDHAALVAAERLPIVLAAIPDAICDPELGPLPFEVAVPQPEQAVIAIVRGNIEHLGPRSIAALAEHLGLDQAAVEAALISLQSEGAVLSQDDGSYCDRRMLARIHRLTLSRLRKQIEPVTAATLNRFLFRWQRVGAGAKLIGAEGLLRVVEQLQGFESAAGAWETEILPARLHSYDESWLDSLCLAGEVAWGRLSTRVVSPEGHSTPTKAAPLALMCRADLAWLRAPSGTPDEAELSERARTVLGHVRGRGASFFAEIANAIDAPPADVEDALWELVGAGLATADGFGCLRVLINRRRGASRSRFDRRTPSAPRSSRWNNTIKRARARDGHRPVSAMRSLPASSGRWSLLGAPDPDAMCPLSTARQLLARYGVVFRDLLGRESTLPPWREVLVALRRLEARGEVRGGRFVRGFVGEQFALPEALEALRAVRREPKAVELVRVCATDPLNLVGVTSPGPRVPAVMGNAILYKNGVPIASIEAGDLVVRHELQTGESVGPGLVYRPAARAAAVVPQANLPF